MAVASDDSGPRLADDQTDPGQVRLDAAALDTAFKDHVESGPSQNLN